jgi:hypothetical protein
MYKIVDARGVDLNIEESGGFNNEVQRQFGDRWMGWGSIQEA